VLFLVGAEAVPRAARVFGPAAHGEARGGTMARVAVLVVVAFDDQLRAPRVEVDGFDGAPARLVALDLQRTPTYHTL
jgi:hypothetical protein